MYIIIFILCVSASVASELPTSPVKAERIVGGVETTVEKYPFIVQVQWGTGLLDWRQLCGGSLISKTTVLTAAHCVERTSSMYIRVVVGTSNTNGDDGTPHYLRKNGISIFPCYDKPRTLNNDIAVLHLETPAVLGPRVQTIKIAAPNYKLPDGDVITVIGWGRLVADGQQPEVLQEVNLNVINHEVCAERYASLKEDPSFEIWPDVTSSMVCSGILDVGEKDACHYDSGGPMIHGNILVGIVSWGYTARCAHPYYPSVFTRVSAFTDWIISTSF